MQKYTITIAFKAGGQEQRPLQAINDDIARSWVNTHYRSHPKCSGLKLERDGKTVEKWGRVHGKR